METVPAGPVDTEPQLSPDEAELLVACARLVVDGGGKARIRSLAARHAIDWDRLINDAREHCVLPLLYRNLNRICGDLVPQRHLQNLRNQYRSGAVHNLALAAELARILAIFEGSGVAAVPFKGPVLAYSVYGDLSLRLFADLDILIHAGDISCATRLLNELGYQHEYKLTRSQELAYIQHEHAFHFVHGITGIIIELHWRLSHRDLSYSIDEAGLWDRTQPADLMGRPIRTLSPEDLFLYLCMHGAKHAWERLEWICCISEFINRSSHLDWEQIAARSKRLGGRRIVAMSLLLAARLFDNQRAAAMLERIPADKVALVLFAKVRTLLFCKKLDHQRREIQRHVFYLQTRERLIDRVRGIVFSCVRTPHPVSMDWQHYHVPASLSFLYYVLRPVRIAREHGVGRLREVLRPDASI
jgi:hypothetical protein